jgi:redox-sensitive bicupin YhaK (pirin superfamily)
VSTTRTKAVETVLASPPTHWVGDGFLVSSVFSPDRIGDRLSPFILLDYGAPVVYEPAEERRGVGEHPHRGFETVTVAFQGEIEHRDSAGNSGRIGPGDVQWMTAGRGVLHEEKHSEEFTRRGGAMEMAQLWVNLPARVKMTEPRYQTLLAKEIPTVPLAGRGRVRVVSGEFEGVRGAARTFSPVTVLDVALPAGAKARFPVPEGHTAAVFVRSGSVWVSGTHSAGERQLALLTREGADVEVEATQDAELLLLAGEPLGEPVFAYGPFVMNTADEVRKAVTDYQSGRFGRLD